MYQKKKNQKIPSKYQGVQKQYHQNHGNKSCKSWRVGWGKISKAECIQLNQAGQKHTENTAVI